MIIGMSTACFFPGLYTEDAVNSIGKMQIKNVEVFLCCMSEYQISFIKELNKRLRDNGMSAYSVHALSLQFEPQLFSDHLRARQDAEDIFCRVVDAAAELGAQSYTFHGPSNVKHAKKYTLNYQKIARIAGALADKAIKNGVKLAWENVHWCWYATPEFASELLNMPETGSLYFTLDLKQAAQAGHDPVDYIKHTNGKLVNIHICDYSVSEERGIYPVLPFKGLMDFKKIKTALASSGYDNALIYEVYSSNYLDFNELKDNYDNVKAFFSA